MTNETENGSNRESQEPEGSRVRAVALGAAGVTAFVFPGYLYLRPSAAFAADRATLTAMHHTVAFALGAVAAITCMFVRWRRSADRTAIDARVALRQIALATAPIAAMALSGAALWVLFPRSLGLDETIARAAWLTPTVVMGGAVAWCIAWIARVRPESLDRGTMTLVRSALFAAAWILAAGDIASMHGTPVDADHGGGAIVAVFGASLIAMLVAAFASARAVGQRRRVGAHGDASAVRAEGRELADRRPVPATSLSIAAAGCAIVLVSRVGDAIERRSFAWMLLALALLVLHSARDMVPSRWRRERWTGVGLGAATLIGAAVGLRATLEALRGWTCGTLHAGAQGASWLATLGACGAERQVTPPGLHAGFSSHPLLLEHVQITAPSVWFAALIGIGLGVAATSLSPTRVSGDHAPYEAGEGRSWPWRAVWLFAAVVVPWLASRLVRVSSVGSAASGAWAFAFALGAVATVAVSSLAESATSHRHTLGTQTGSNRRQSVGFSLVFVTLWMALLASTHVGSAGQRTQGLGAVDEASGGVVAPSVGT